MRIIIVGASGFVGSNLVRYLSTKHYVVAAIHEKPFSFPLAIPGLGTYQRYALDATQQSHVSNLFATHQPEAVINAAGCKDLAKCQSAPGLAYLTNTRIPATLAIECERRKVKLIQISTDHVFAGNLVYPFDETSKAIPNTVYGYTKLAAEILCQICPQSTVIRTGGLYGINSKLFGEARAALAGGKTIFGYTNVFNTPTYIGNLAKAIERLLATETTGLCHIADIDSVNRYNLLLAFASVFGFDKSLVMPTEAPPALLPANVSLGSRYEIPEAGNIYDGLEKLKVELCALQ